jgi:hypothetical protein
MANNAETTAKNSEKATTNAPGYCLKECRQWAGIPSKYNDAATAWKNTNDRYPGNRNPPRGSAVYWGGGSSGYGHIAISVGNGKVRSTDAGGSGKVATVSLSWVENNWGLPYGGWAWDINEVTIPHSGDTGGGLDDVGLQDEITEWSPDEGTSDDKTTVGKTLNQARGYSEDTYQRLTKLQDKVNALDDKVDKILNAVT